MITVYGTTDSEGIHTDTSNTLRGAKCYATRNNYTNVSKRVGYSVFVVAKKINNKWVNSIL